MKDIDKARALATSIVNVAAAADTPVTALLTDMNEVLGRTAGNNVEVLETLEFLENPTDADQRLLDVTLAQAAEMLSLSGAVAADKAMDAAKEALNSGKAREVFAKMVVAQGGPTDLFEKRDEHLPLAGTVKQVIADKDGYIDAVDTRRIGMAVVALGGGRTVSGAKVDHHVGFTNCMPLGTKISKGDQLAVVYAQSDDAADYAATEYQQAYSVSDKPVEKSAIVAELVKKS